VQNILFDCISKIPAINNHFNRYGFIYIYCAEDYRLYSLTVLLTLQSIVGKKDSLAFIVYFDQTV